MRISDWSSDVCSSDLYKDVLPKWLLDEPDRFIRLFDRLTAFEHAQTGPRCLVHGDSHQGNSYVRPNGERVWLDWQLVRKGRPWRDVKRSEEHTSEPQSLMRISYAVFCLKKKITKTHIQRQ